MIEPARRPAFPDLARAVRSHKRSFCVIDVETTGLNPATDRIVEIAIVRIDGRGHVLDEHDQLVACPELGATAVHGITDHDLRGAPAFGDMAPAVIRALRDSIIVGHNVAFDLAFLDAELDRARMHRPGQLSLCTMAMGHALGLHGPRMALDDACAQLAVPIERRHRAPADARATAHLLAAQLEVAQTRSSTPIGVHRSLAATSPTVSTEAT